MDRRTFLALASGAAAWPALTRAQGARKLPRIGMAAFPPLSSLAPFIAAFEKGLREEGLVPGRDVALDFRSANLDTARYGEVVRDLVRSKPDVIITGINANTAAVRAETRTIPIVMTVGVTPVAEGFIKSLSHPGGNVTGLTYDVGAESWQKRFELFKLAVPSIRRVAVLYDADVGTANAVELNEAAARSVGLESLQHEIGDDFQETFSIAKRWRADAVLFFAGARQTARRAELIAATLKYRLPSNFPNAYFVEAGGLMSYGPSILDLYRRAAGYVSRILKGARPGDLPVQQPISLELVINLKTAKALGLTIPQEILLRADRVIE
jgi:putative ABC transport system substrate-binding protein